MTFFRSFLSLVEADERSKNVEEEEEEPRRAIILDTHSRRSGEGREWAMEKKTKKKKTTRAGKKMKPLAETWWWWCRRAMCFCVVFPHFCLLSLFLRRRRLLLAWYFVWQIYHKVALTNRAALSLFTQPLPTHSGRQQSRQCIEANISNRSDKVLRFFDRTPQKFVLLFCDLSIDLFSVESRRGSKLNAFVRWERDLREQKAVNNKEHNGKTLNESSEAIRRRRKSN